MNIHSTSHVHNNELITFPIRFQITIFCIVNMPIEYTIYVKKNVQSDLSVQIAFKIVDLLEYDLGLWNYN